MKNIIGGIFSFITSNPLIFIVIVLVIYTIIAVTSLKNRVKEIEKSFKPIRSYLLSKFDSITTLLNQLITKYSEEEKVTNELNRVLNDINTLKSGNINSLVKLSNSINSFVLNTALLRTKDYPELNILYNIELFKGETEEELDIEKRRKNYNELIKDFNHDIINPPNNIISSLFNIGDNYIMIENNEGKTPKTAPVNYIKNDQVVKQAPKSNQNISEEKVEKAPNALGTEEVRLKKVCPECNTEFYNVKFCPTCGRMVD